MLFHGNPVELDRVEATSAVIGSAPARTAYGYSSELVSVEGLLLACQAVWVSGRFIALTHRHRD